MRAMAYARLAAAAVLITCLAATRLGAELPHPDRPILGGLRPLLVLGRTRRREGGARDCGPGRAADRASSRALRQQAVRRDAAVVHEDARGHVAARPDGFLHRRRSSRRRLHAEFLPLG